jgi:hypothetical protein
MARPQLSFFFSRRSFSEAPRCRGPAINDRGYSADSNEVETSKYSGFWLPRVGTTRILFPAFTPEMLRGLAMGNRIQSQQRNCSRFSREFLAPLHNRTDKELSPEVAGRVRMLKIYFGTNGDQASREAI